MDIVNPMLSDTALMALFGTNTAPTPDDITGAKQDAATYGDVADRLIAAVGLKSGLYASEQPVYGPLVRLMSVAGWTVSGAGYFSVVFYKGGLAMKLSLRRAADTALDYLKWCNSHAGLPGLPAVHSVQEFTNSYAVLMDRYECIRTLANIDHADFDPSVRAEYEEVKGALETGHTGHFPTSHTAATIRLAFQNHGAVDCHTGNIMIDRYGQIVITDPLGSSYAYPANDDEVAYDSAPVRSRG